jgi:hypothetical protein
MRVPNLDTILYVTLTISVACLFLGGFTESKIISGIGGLFLLIGIGNVAWVIACALWMTFRNRRK